jgi:N-acyl-D-aspartate/D-glutamate deacylase
MHELVIRDGVIVDGTGAPRFGGDVAVDADGRITEVGEVHGPAKQEVDAEGCVVAPGWVDIHTHYDGQVTWDPEVTPSSGHGVTTVVMGNCGVGFAPARPDGHEFLIELMEGVEDIPGTALAEGITWDWETFPEYLDAVASMPRTVEVAAQVPHAALRAYVMGERAHEQPDADEIGQIAALAQEAMEAGAVGISTSRTILHSSKHGLVPGTDAPPDELLALGDALGAAGRGVFELVSDSQGGEADQAWMLDLARRTGRTVTFALAQTPYAPEGFREALDTAQRLRQEEGLRIVPQVASRPTGMLFGLQSSLHPFSTHPTYRSLADLPLAERVARLRDPEVRARLLSEQPATKNRIAVTLMQRWSQIFPLGDPPDYEPPASASVEGVAAATGGDPQAIVLDWLLERDGKAFLFAPLASYVDHDHEAIREMMTHPAAVLGLSDGGAHCGLICDASFPTHLLTHWVRDRARGPKLDLEQVVHLQTAKTASVYGFADRGTLEPGKRADLNVIDVDGLRLHAPEMVFDLPAGGRRLAQAATGYRTTVVGGQVTYVDGQATGLRPAGLLRS